MARDPSDPRPPTEPPLDVFGVGQCAYDRFLRVPHFPGSHEKVEGDDALEACGGPVATALWALSHWGRRTALAGVVGDDESGRKIRADLDAGGVDATRLLTRPGTRSQEAFIAVARGDGERRIFWRRPTGAPPAASEVHAPACRVLLTDGLFEEASLAAAQHAETTVVDAGTLREGTEALLEVADVFVASTAFATAYVGNDDPWKACDAIRARGVRVAAVTRGDRGWVALIGDTRLEGPAWPATAIDTTGCGDVFHAAVVEGVLRDWPWERTFDAAAWAAAACATRLGGRAGVPAIGDHPYAG